MIALLLVACSHPAPDTGDTAAPAFAPKPGIWTFAWDKKYKGDCVLEDMKTEMPATESWRIELTPTAFDFFDATDYPMGCSLTDMAFSCSKGSDLIDDRPYGLDAQELTTTTYGGTFSASTSLDGERDIAVECEGADCATYGTQYGPDFTYPCTAVAGFSGTWTSDG